MSFEELGKESFLIIVEHKIEVLSMQACGVAEWFLLTSELLSAVPDQPVVLDPGKSSSWLQRWKTVKFFLGYRSTVQSWVIIFITERCMMLCLGWKTKPEKSFNKRRISLEHKFFIVYYILFYPFFNRNNEDYYI